MSVNNLGSDSGRGEMPPIMHIFSRVLGYLFTREYELGNRDVDQNTISCGVRLVRRRCGP